MAYRYVTHGLETRCRRVEVQCRIATRANAWTASGIAAAIVCIALILYSAEPLLIPVMFAYIGITDIVDGRSAEKWDAHTRLGAVLDPIRDRMLSLVFLVVAYRAASPAIDVLICTIIVAEAIAGAGNLIWGERVHLLGKARTAIHGCLALAFFMEEFWEVPLRLTLATVMFAMAIASLAALAAYIFEWVRGEEVP